MIRTVLYRNAAKQLTGYSAKGHSGYAEEGSDIICAAVSILGATCVNSLESVAGVIPVITANDDGILEFHLPDGLDELPMHDAQVLLGALKQGLSDLAEQFPQYVRLSIQDWRK